MAKKLKLWNGRWGPHGHIYVAAYSQQDVIALLQELTGRKNPVSLSEIRVYWSAGQWGNRTGLNSVTKRVRNKKCAPGQLRAYWGTESRGDYPDVILHNGDGVSPRDRSLLYFHLCTKKDGCESLMDELKARGYDITTLDFSIRKLPSPPTPGAPHD